MDPYFFPFNTGCINAIHRKECKEKAIHRKEKAKTRKGRKEQKTTQHKDGTHISIGMQWPKEQDKEDRHPD